MIEFSLETDGPFKGNPRIMAVTAEPKDQAELLRIQEDVSRVCQMADPTRADRLHLTLWNLGRPNNLRSRLLNASLDLSSTTYDGHLEALVADLLTISTPDIELIAEKLEVLKGPGGSCLVVNMQRTGQLMEARKPYTARIKKFLRGCGIVDPLGFMGAHTDLKQQRDFAYNPHVTIGRGLATPQVPDLQVAKGAITFQGAGLINVRLAQGS